MSKIIDSIIGHAVGDAMGVPTEFCIRERLLSNPVTKMIGSAKTGQPAGSWSDDTSMVICTIDSFIQNSKFDYIITDELFDEIYRTKFPNSSPGMPLLFCKGAVITKNKFLESLNNLGYDITKRSENLDDW